MPCTAKQKYGRCVAERLLQGTPMCLQTDREDIVK